MPTADDILLQRWYAHGDAAAFREITARYANLVYAAAQRVLKNAGDAEDVAQECFEALALRCDRAPDYLGAWLHTAATNRALTVLRSSQRRRSREEHAAADLPHSTRAQWDDLYEHVDAAIASLPDEFRAAVVGHFLEGRSKAELARVLGISRPTVHYRVDKGLEKVRGALRQRGVTASGAALATAMAAERTVAVPAGLTAALGKIAVSSANTLSAGGVIATHAALAGTLVLKKFLVVAVVAVLAAGGIGVALLQQSPPPAPPPDGAPAAPPVESGEEPIAGVPAATLPVSPAPVPAAAAVSAVVPPVFDAGLGDLSIAGRVVDTREQPIEGAVLAIDRASWEDMSWGGPAPDKRPKGTVEAISGPDGEFRVTGFAPGSFSGQIRHERFARGILRLAAGDEAVLVVMRDTIQVSGQVVDAESGAPVPQFEIASQSGEPRTVNDAEGRFNLANVSPDDPSITVRAEGYVKSFTRIAAGADGTVPDLQIALTPGRVVEGRVTGARGEPVSRAWIFAATPVEPAQLTRVDGAYITAREEVYARRGVAVTDGTGFFRLGELRGDEKAIYALHPEKGGGQVSLAWNGDAPIRDANIVLERASGVLEVQVTAGGEPLAGATVSAMGDAGGLYTGATTDADGLATLLAIPSGAVSVRAEFPGGKGNPRTLTSLAESRSRAITEVQIEFASATAVVEGRVITGNSDPVKGGVNLSVTSAMGTEQYRGSFDDAGNFIIDQVIAGEAKLSMYIMANRKRIERRESLTIEEGENHWVEFDITAEGTVEGTVAGIAPGHSGEMIVVPGNVALSGSPAERLETLGQNMAGSRGIGGRGSYEKDGVNYGFYTIGALSPGRYTLVCFVYPDSSAGDPNTFRFFTQPVDIKAGETASVDFDVRE